MSSPITQARERVMPQKKNPYALAVIRTQAGQAAETSRRPGPPAHRLGSHRSLPSAERRVPRALDAAVAIARLRRLIEGIEIGWSGCAGSRGRVRQGMADVSDVLAMTTGLDYRRAHKIVGRAVRDLGGPRAGHARERARPSGSPPRPRPPSAGRSRSTRRRSATRSIRRRAPPPACRPARRPRRRWTRCSRGSPRRSEQHAAWSDEAREREAAAEAALLARARALAGTP